MTDPFVQRMMARSQARRGQNKENAAITDSTRNRLNLINARYSEDTQPTLNPLRTSNSDLESQQDSIDIKRLDSSPKKFVTSPKKEYSCPSLITTKVTTSPTRPRLNALVRRSQQMNDWEDDYSYHSTSPSCQEAQGFTPTESRSRLYYDFKKEQQTPRQEEASIAVSPSKVKGLSLAEFMRTSPTKVRSSIKEKSISASSNQLGSVHTNVGASAPTPPPPPPPVILTCHPKSPAVSPVRTLSRIPSPEPKPPKGYSRDSSPSKVGEMRSRWEQHIRDTSPERLDRSRSPVKSHSRPHSPVKSFASESGCYIRPGSPVKSFGSQSSSQIRPGSPVKSFASESDCYIRPGSPVKSFGSQSSSQIRPGSPVKSFGSQSSSQIRPGSPVKSFDSQSSSHIRPGSPVKSFASQSGRYTRSGSPVNGSSPSRTGGLTRQLSRDHYFEQESRSIRDHSPSKDQGGLTRCGPERRSRRDISPHKPPPVGEIVKGETPMPEAVPIVNEPYMSSVRARAAAFDSAGGSHEPQKDPAERSLQERRALFSKNQGGALVPKAPFGQAIPTKNLHANGSNGIHDRENKTSVAHSHPVNKPTKRMAVEPAPAVSQKLQQIQRGYRSPSPSKDDENSLNTQRIKFENVKDNWRDNEINSKIQTERQKEMDILLNRFKKPKVNGRADVASHITTPQHPQNEQPRYPVESETEYAESDESFADSTTSDDISVKANSSGPPKPPRLYLDSTSSGSSGVSSSPPCPPPAPFSDGSPIQRRRSPAARLNSTEIEEVRPSPKKEFVPKIKPGCLFPSLSDIESHSEAPDSQDEDDVQDSSFAESILTCASIESLGQQIKQVAQSNLNQQLSTIAEQSEMSSGIGFSMSESTIEAIDAIDNAIDEALDDGPTPPKRSRHSHEDDSSNVFKTPKINPGTPCHNQEDQNLAHSISMYRRQKPDVTYTPVRQVIRHPDLRSPTPEPQDSPSVTVSARIRELQEEVAEQQRVISQASNAVTVVLQHIEHQGAPQHVEAEKVLLLATQKRQTALDEIQRLKTEGALAQRSWGVEEDCCRGSISISNLSVPLKQEFVKKGINGNEIYHLIVLVKHREQVISSQLLATPSCVVDGSITFPNLMSLHNLASDFIISLEVYALRTIAARNLPIKKDHSRMKLTPLKRLQKSESRMASPSVQSPGGPYAVRTSSFQLVGFTHLNISTLTRNAWTLEKVPFSSPLNGHLLMRVSCSFEGGITERGFLTMFEDIGGFGAWNRRWCVLSGMYLRYWRYPDDETKKEANGQIDLRSCTTRRVEVVSRDICARQHTFQLVCLRPAYVGDISNLVQELHGSSLVTKHLLSADSKEERIQWCNKLNKSLANIRAWDPDALRPEDYQV